MIDLYYVNDEYKYEAEIKKMTSGDTISWWLRTYEGTARFIRDRVCDTLEEAYNHIEKDIESCKSLLIHKI